MADGFRVDGSGFLRHETDFGDLIDLDILKDALAAQLIWQVDALPNTKDGRMEVFVTSEDTDVFLQATSGLSGYYKGTLIRGKDRTMNTIKAIVDSEVLENDCVYC